MLLLIYWVPIVYLHVQLNNCKMYTTVLSMFCILKVLFVSVYIQQMFLESDRLGTSLCASH